MPERNAYFFKCFAHESRNDLLRLLGQNGEMTVDSLADASSVTASTVSRHLNMLKMQGIVGVRMEPPSHYYYLNEDVILQRFREFAAFLGIDEQGLTGKSSEDDGVDPDIATIPRAQER